VIDILAKEQDSQQKNIIGRVAQEQKRAGENDRCYQGSYRRAERNPEGAGEDDGRYRGSQSLQQPCQYCLTQNITTGGCQNEGDERAKVGGLDNNEFYRVGDTRGTHQEGEERVCIFLAVTMVITMSKTMTLSDF